MKIGDMGIRVMSAGYDVVITHSYEMNSRDHYNYKTHKDYNSTKKVRHTRSNPGLGHARHS